VGGDEPEERRRLAGLIAELERLIARTTTHGAPDCACPAGAERTCLGLGCPASPLAKHEAGRWPLGPTSPNSSAK